MNTSRRQTGRRNQGAEQTTENNNTHADTNMQSIQARSLAGRWRMRDEVPEAQHTQTMELSPGKSECPAHVLEDLVMVDELAAKTWVPF